MRSIVGQSDLNTSVPSACLVQALLYTVRVYVSAPSHAGRNNINDHQ